MAAPNTSGREIDLSTRVPSFPGVYGSITIATRRGDNLRPTLITSEAQFLNELTPNGKIEIGYDIAHFSALAFLKKSNKLWVTRAIASSYLFGTAHFYRDTISPAIAKVVATGINNPIAHAFGDESFFLYGADPGTWNNNIGVKILGYKVAETVTADASTNIITGAQNWCSGTAVRFTATTTIPAGLTADTIYYAVKTGGIGQFKVSTSYVDSISATPALTIDITSNGAGVTAIPVNEYVKEAGTFRIEVYYGADTRTPVESFVVSLVQGAKDGYGQNLYIDDVLKSSGYIRGLRNLLATTALPDDVFAVTKLLGGDDETLVTDSSRINALNQIYNANDIQCTLVMDGGYTTVPFHQAMIELAQTRKDCVSILSTPYSAEADAKYLNKIVDYRRFDLNANSSYASLYTPHVKIYDKFNDRDIMAAPDGYVGAAISETASNYEIWYPVGGNKRGILTVSDTRRRFSDGEMDYLYDNGINPIKFEPGRGIKIWGQKTLLARPSSLDRLNVRLLLITLYPAVKEALQDFLFEINDDSTRAIATAILTSYFDNIKARRGVYAFSVVCDDTNNSPEDIDNYRMNVDIYLQPVKSIEYIPFSFIITRTGVDFKQVQNS